MVIEFGRVVYCGSVTELGGRLLVGQWSRVGEMLLGSILKTASANRTACPRLTKPVRLSPYFYTSVNSITSLIQAAIREAQQLTYFAAVICGHSSV